MAKISQWSSLRRIYRINCRIDQIWHSQYDLKPTYTPLPENYKLPEKDEKLHQEAKKKKLPYRELVGSMIYPACQTSLEMKHAVSILGKFMSCYTQEAFDLALHALAYGYTTRHYGVIYSLGLDAHGVAVLYAYADSNFEAPRSQGGHTLMYNGAAIMNTSKKHSTVDVSTTAAELTELFHCALNL